jgi:hypothetical protein
MHDTLLARTLVGMLSVHESAVKPGSAVRTGCAPDELRARVGRFEVIANGRLHRKLNPRDEDHGLGGCGWCLGVGLLGRKFVRSLGG